MTLLLVLAAFALGLLAGVAWWWDEIVEELGR